MTVALAAPAEVPAGGIFYATLDLTGIVDLNAASYHVVFEPSVLAFMDATAGDIGGTAVPVDLWNEVSSGVVSIVQAMPGLDSASGSGYLARLEFEVVGAEGSSSAIGFDYRPELRVLSNVLAEEIPSDFVGTTVIVVAQ